MDEKFEMKISDKVRIVKATNTFVIKADNVGMIFNTKKNKTERQKPSECYYEILHQAVARGLHLAIERETPEDAVQYIELLKEFRDEVLSTADFVEYKYKIVKVAP